MTKRADASTLSVVRNVKEDLPKMQAVLPDDIKVSFEFDQSPTVTSAIAEPGDRGGLGAVLTGLMVLRLPARLAERDRRRPEHPVRHLRGAGGALAHGPDDQPDDAGRAGAGDRHPRRRGDRRDREHPPQDGADRSVALGRPAGEHGHGGTAAAGDALHSGRVPAVVLHAGGGAGLFVPLSLAVGFAMVASYLLSSTFVPVLSAWLLRDQQRPDGTAGGPCSIAIGALTTGLWPSSSAGGGWPCRPTWLSAAVVIFVVGPETGPGDLSQGRRRPVPAPDAAPTGTRIEGTEKLALEVLGDDPMRSGPDDVEISVGYVGFIPSSYPINAIYQWTGGPEEAVLRIALKRGRPAPSRT